jgi:hypothetical protein
MKSVRTTSHLFYFCGELGNQELILAMIHLVDGIRGKEEVAKGLVETRALSGRT